MFQKYPYIVDHMNLIVETVMKLHLYHNLMLNKIIVLINILYLVSIK